MTVSEPFPTCYLNGDFLPLVEARVSPLDRAFLFADGVYEVVPVHRGRPFRLREHLERLERSLAAIRLEPPLGMAGWAQIVTELVSRAAAAEILVYIQISRGAERGRNHLFPRAASPTTFAFASPYPVPDARILERGLAAATLPDIRWQRCDIKATALLANVLLRQQAADAGCDEALLVSDGLLREGSSSTVLALIDGRIRTPPNDQHILPGTSRDALLELASGWLPVSIGPVTVEDLRRAEEVWIASAGRGLLPVTRIDDLPVGDGRPGPCWRQLYRRLQDHLDEIAATPALGTG
jgi:D-alanine transaminase